MQENSNRISKCSFFQFGFIIQTLSCQFPLGAHLVVQHFGYSHHGIYIGNGHVIHYSGFVHFFKKRPIEITTLENFAQGKKIIIRFYEHPKFTGGRVVKRIKSRMHENKYNLIVNNCEHLCTWAITGVENSLQVVKMMQRLTTVGYASSILGYMNSLWFALTTTCFALVFYIRNKLKQKNKTKKKFISKTKP